MIIALRNAGLFALTLFLGGCIEFPIGNGQNSPDDSGEPIIFSADLALGTSKEIFVDSGSHTFTVLKLHGDTTRVEIRSDPIVVELVKGAEEPVDVDSDGAADMLLTVRAIVDSTVSLEFVIPAGRVSYSEKQDSPVWGVKPGTVIPLGTTYLLSDIPKPYTFPLAPPRSRCDFDGGLYSSDNYNEALEQNNGGTRVEIHAQSGQGPSQTDPGYMIIGITEARGTGYYVDCLPVPASGPVLPFGESTPIDVNFDGTYDHDAFPVKFDQRTSQLTLKLKER
jgi:hypothetical protein